jgi:hypothetical protein
MNPFNPKNQHLFCYFIDNRPGFWIFDGKQYHHLIHQETGLVYIHAHACLPGGAYGETVHVPGNLVRSLERAAKTHHFNLSLFKDAQKAAQAETLKVHPCHVFGAIEPAGYFMLNSLYPHHEDGGGEY